MAFEPISVPENNAPIGVNRGFSCDVDSREVDGSGVKLVSRGVADKKFQSGIDMTVIQDTLV